MTHDFGGKFIRDQGKFWSIKSLTSDTLKFKVRGGRSRSVVAVFDPVRKDYRVKLWLDETTHEAVKSLQHETGHAFTLTHIKDGFYQGQVKSSSLWRMLNDKPPVDPLDQDDDDEAQAKDDLKDFCVETRFDLDRTEGRYGASPGDVSDFPDWMQATGIQIDKETRGQGTFVYLQVGKTSSDFQLLRINGVWMPGMPFNPTSWLYSIPPEAEDEVRNYGDGITEISIPNEVRPPRFPQEVRRICLFLRDNGERNVPYAEWRNDAQQWQYKIYGMCTAYGQRAIFEGRRAYNDKRLAFYAGAIQRRYKRTQAAGAVDVGLGPIEWAKKIGGDPLGKFAKNVSELTSGIKKCDDYIARFSESYDKLKTDFDAIVERLEDKEERYKDAIELLHPRA